MDLLKNKGSKRFAAMDWKSINSQPKTSNIREFPKSFTTIPTDNRLHLQRDSPIIAENNRATVTSRRKKFLSTGFRVHAKTVKKGDGIFSGTEESGGGRLGNFLISQDTRRRAFLDRDPRRGLPAFPSNPFPSRGHPSFSYPKRGSRARGGWKPLRPATWLPVGEGVRGRREEGKRRGQAWT